MHDLRRRPGHRTVLVSTLERVPVKSADAFVAFSGLDPRPDDSGQRPGRGASPDAGLPNCASRLLGGDVGNQDEDLEATLRALLGKGLSGTATHVIFARRSARTARSIYTRKTAFDPERLTKALT